MALLKFICFLAISCARIRAHPKGETYQDIEFDRRLKLINKPAIKTIEVNHEVFDCVDIYKQPAFDNPLLKTHKIQMKPTHLPIRSNKIGKIDHLTEQYSGLGLPINCPKGTVPIRRTTKADLIREKSIRHIKAYYPTAARNPEMHFGVLEVHHDDKYKIIGAKSGVGIFKPQVNQGESSAAQIWLSDGNIDDGISAGWMVDPVLYGDSEPHFTASWMGKGGAGCFNMLCPGYVQVDSKYPLGFILSKVSQPGVKPVVGIDTWIHQDNVTKNWWLAAWDDYTPLGYWPGELFSTFEEGAKLLSYGGMVKAIPGQQSPPMGSGYDDKCDYFRTAFFAQAQYQGTDEVLKDIYLPVRKEYTKIRVDCPIHGVYYPCKSVKYMDFYFLYGGPRGNCDHAS